ncbi:flagellar assembly peptidoglycan hydrolase FlgJ [Ectopseudomonas mendocina]|jgi:flagellar protein FlgJ|uniref:Peptidoglycan hydrolase FlgJ n=2 Tax=Ectopseudomonas mendocina TaxID=300 RepID=A0A379IY06_ECTME|nr:flagellar assembly peptidoglycan hydrolase FlgJ [Pseudomonas mendocina]AEB57856.1 flagellar rod assembly protein/muramidase FlgJ [Pseudomonas mendocina NK-01]ALN18838.1 flagellar biosynthesis protein FlgJ [Pseudomonas mendocina S5.2]KES00306.1 flagellar rod assembly protein FlgJ [Pseudomonas mendocina]MDF2077132.1 flagellar assembly peptidoglycan hydrolase FlgJ [Pseudomonas mendocina]SUD40723.1 flagellar rod assembly protein/muramidase FlgJ [Pseudomonas mendocina]
MDSRLSAGLLGNGKSPIDSGAFTDLNRLNQFKVGGDTEQNIRKVAQEFESLFMNEMLKAMRSANAAFGEGNFMNSNESKTYQDMHDQQLAVTLSKEGRGIGLADVLVRQMSKIKQPSSRPNPFAQIEQPVAASSETKADKVASSEGFRDDVALLNRRRLAVPGKLADRLLAGIVPSTGEGEGKALAGNDWIPAQTASTASKGQGLSLGNSDALTGRRIAQPPLAPGKAAFSSPQEFVATMLPMAEAAAEKIGVDPRYLVAQAALETGWGKSIIRTGDGQSSHNLFGIKSHNSWDGESARVLTTEYKGGKAVREAANFRAYDSYAQSFDDYVSFLQNNGRYEKALNVTENPERFVKELQQAGYATDPNYARKISQIARKMQTYQAIAAADSATTRT